MKTITKTQKVKEGERIHVQKVSIDFEDRFMSVIHNGNEIALSIDAWSELVELTVAIFWENGNK